jgi:hypothetical protein
MQKVIRIFLLVLIIIGIIALFTQKIWVPKLVDRILLSETPQVINSNINVNIDNISEKADLIRLIRVDSPKPNQIISSPLAITGTARGSWFFEASFPIVLVDWDGLIIANGVATAKENWMTSDFVPFEAKLTFIVDRKAYSDKGALILRKDNPSGLPENDDALEIPIIFSKE